MHKYHDKAVWKVGDIIEQTTDGHETIYREIIEVKKGGYTWRYPNLPADVKIDNYFYSQDSSDPMLRWDWQLSDKKFN